MTYKELVDKIESTVNDHVMLADFGYGQLSDIKILDEDNDGADYPYVFLVPAGVTRNNQSTVYSFSMIIMEMALTPHDVLKIQSDAIQYLNDLLASLRYDTSFDGDTLLNSSTQVFRERFQDDVAGATASFQIAIPDAMDTCYSPVLTYDEIVHVTNTVDRLIGPDPGIDSVLVFDNSIVNDGNWNLNSYTVPSVGQYRFNLTQNVVFNALLPGEVYPSEVVIAETGTGNQYTATISNWPEAPEVGVTYSLDMTWDIALETTGVLEFLRLPNTPADESTMTQKAGGSLKIYRN